MSKQTNTRVGDIVVAANEDLTGKEGRLARLVSDSGTAKAARCPMTWRTRSSTSSSKAAPPT